MEPCSVLQDLESEVCVCLVSVTGAVVPLCVCFDSFGYFFHYEAAGAVHYG